MKGRHETAQSLIREVKHSNEKNGVKEKKKGAKSMEKKRNQDATETDTQKIKTVFFESVPFRATIDVHSHLRPCMKYSSALW